MGSEETTEEVETSVSMVAHEVTDTSEPGTSIVAHVVQETEPEEEPEDVLEDNKDASSKEAVVVHESDEESTPELEEVKDVEKSKEEEDEKEVEVAPGTGESGACSLEATCESPTDCDLNSDRGSEEGGVSTDEGIVGSDEDDKEEKSDADLEKAKKSTEAE